MHSTCHQISGDMPSFHTATAPSYSALPKPLAIPGVMAGRRGSSLANAIGLRRKSEIDIVLDGEAEFVHSYSTFDEIKGRANIKFDKDTSFDNLCITFEGQSSTYVERITTTTPTTGRTTGNQTFLRVQQPIDQSCLPADGVFRGNVTYSVPFNFVVPDRLLPFICTHKVVDEDIRHDHTQLPPSIGDPNVSGEGNTLLDDMAPEMAKIVYSIRARISRYNAVGRLLELADKSERVRLVPARDEAPPLTMGEPHPLDEHVMRREKSVKRGLFKMGKTGRLTAETSQPKSLRLPYAGRRPTEPVSTMATINLRFDPQTGTDEPPQLDSIVTKLKANTFFGAAPYSRRPELRKHDNWSTLHGVYSQSITLASRRASTVSWTRHSPSDRDMSFSSLSSSSSQISRRPSSNSTSTTLSIPEPSCSYQPGSPFYTASVLVPVALPTTSSKVFVPTFHSCIISRTYTLDLDISFRGPGPSSHINLRTPTQVSAEAGVSPNPQESDDAILAEIEQQFGLYERDVVGLDDQTPIYEETNSSSTSSLLPAFTAVASAPYHCGVNTTTTTTTAAAAAAPPEYHAGLPAAYSPRDVSGGPRMQTHTPTLGRLGIFA